MPKVYNVSVYLDINTVSCPGVWLCPKGKAFLKICLFGVSDLTKEVDPFFPLVFKERFHFQKVFKNMNSVYELHDKLGRSIISLELLQCPIGSAGCVKLALFNALLSDILHPYTTCFSKPLHASGLELLFTACKVFPGIIAPKADVFTKVMVTDSVDGGKSQKMERLRSRSVNDDEKRRQHKVCHTKNNTNCRCFQSYDEQGEDVNKTYYSPAMEKTLEESEEISSTDIEESKLRQAIRAEVENKYDNRKTEHGRTERDNVLGDHNTPSRVNRDQESAFIGGHHNGRETGRPTTVPEEYISGGRNFGSRQDDRSGIEDIPSNRYRQHTTAHGKRGEHQQEQAIVDWRAPDESRLRNSSGDRYGPERVTSCERLLRDYNYDAIRRTDDEGLRGRYFRCFKERRPNGHSTPQQDRERGEAFENGGDLRMTDEPLYESLPDKPLKSTVNGSCTCLHSYNKKLKKSTKTTRGKRSRQEQDQYDQQTPVARTSTRDDDYKYVIRRPVDERQAAEMPPVSEYRDGYRESSKPQRIRSRSDMEVYNRHPIQRQGGRSSNDQKHIWDQTGWKSHERRDELQAGEMPRRSEYKDGYRERDLPQMMKDDEYRGPSGLDARPMGGYEELRRSNVPETQGGRGDRVQKETDENRGYSTRHEPVLGQIPVTRPANTQPDRQNRNRDDRDVIPSDRPDGPSYRPPNVRRERSSDVLPIKPAGKPTYASNDKGKPGKSTPEHSDDDSSDGECKCHLCKNYQETYKPKTHPCPRFRKTTGMSSKIRHSKSNTGPKKVIPSRRSKVTKSSNDRDGCGFANCDTLEHDSIAKKKDIKKFYRQT